MRFPDLDTRRRPVRNLVRFPYLGRRVAAAIVWGFVSMGTVGGAVSEPGESIGIAQLGLQRWNQDSGLAGNWVRDIARDEEGAIWVATSGGLSRFDGRSFVNWSTETAHELPTDSITSVAVGTGGRLWIGFARNGVRSLREGRVETDPRLDAFPGSLVVNDLLEDARGTLWIGSTRGLWKLPGNSPAAVAVEPVLREANVRALVSADGKEIWVRTADHGVWRLRSGRAEELPEIRGCYGADLALGVDGSVFTSCADGLWRMVPGGTRWNQISSARGVVTLFVDRSGALWFGSRDGLTRWVEGVEEVLPADRGLGDWRLRAWLEDEDGLWVGTFSAGLSRLRRGPLRSIGAAEGLPIQETTAVLARPDGTVWIGSYRNGLVHWSLRDGLIRHWTSADGLPSDAIWALTADPRRSQRVWVGTGRGLAWIEGDRVSSFGPLGLAYDDDVRVVHLDTAEPGAIWVAGFSGGILEMRGPDRILHDRRNGLGLARVRVLHRDRQDRLLAAGEGGLFRLEEQRWVSELFDELGALSLTALLEEDDGALWLGSESSGLLHRTAHGATGAVQRSGVSVSPIHSIALDSQDGLWISGNEGLFRLWTSEHESWRSGRVDGIPERFSRRDGLRDVETNGWGRPASTRLPDGRLVYPTQRGVAVVDADAMPEVVLEPHEVRVLDGWARDRALELGSPVHLGTSERSLRIRFSAIETLRPEAVTFRYRLEGYDDDWLSSGSLREASYNRLAPGRFRFRLQARLPGRPWVESASSLQIVVAPFVWETAWFRASLLLVALSLAYAGYRFRVGAIERRGRELETMVAVRTENLKESEDRFRALSESTFEGIVIHEQGVIIESNSVMARMLGYEPSELIGTSILDLVAPESRRDVQERIDAGYEGAYEFHGLKQGGSRIIAEVHVKTLEYRGRNLSGSAVRDITQRKQREEELLAAKQTAEAANRAKSSFLSTMSHELRTPLSAILGFAQLIARDQRLVGEQRENARIIGRSGEHLLDLIDDVLEMSKIEAGRSAMEITDVDPGATAEVVEQMMGGRAREKGLELIVERAPNLPTRVRCDEHKLRQVLINLVGNAIQYTAQGRVELRASVAEIDGEPSVRFQVVDSGVGVDPDRMRTIFEPFVRHEHKATTGTGLGLAISREYVQLMGGDDIHVTSRPGEGSSFWFTLPCQPSRASTAGGGRSHQPEPVRRVVALRPDQPEIRIVIADDDATGRTLLRRILEPVGFAIEEAVDGREAMELHQSWQPNLILMDMRMPEMDGLTAVRRIREADNGDVGGNVGGKRACIIAVTAEAFEENREKALGGGCDDFLTKPFRESALFELLRAHLDVEYVYEETGEAPPPKASEALRDLAPRMRHLSYSVLLELEQAAAALEPQTLEGVIETIRPLDPCTAEGLSALAGDFDYKRIMTLARDAR